MMKKLNVQTIVLMLILALTLSSFISCKKEVAKPEVTETPPFDGTVTDVDGNVYKTVKIGTQIWMAENLKVSRLNNGSPISLITEVTTWKNPDYNIPMMCYYADKYENFEKYGALYNWHAVNTGKLAPKGWHVSTKADWEKLRDYMIAKGYNFDGTVSGNKIAKSLAAASGWTADPTHGNVGNDQQSNNKSGFNALAGGYRTSSGSYFYLGNTSIYWSTNPTPLGINQMDYFDLSSKEKFLSNGSVAFTSGLSVRCVKD